MSKTYLDDNGYLRFNDSNRLVHRWIAQKYLYNRYDYSSSFSHYVVHHKDGNKLNNNIDNLEILSDDEHCETHGILNSKSDCFIATAAYGTPFAVEIQILRKWKDNYLVKNELGVSFIKFYYWFTPPIANFIRKSDILRKVTRTLLYPIVKLLKTFYS